METHTHAHFIHNNRGTDHSLGLEQQLVQLTQRRHFLIHPEEGAFADLCIVDELVKERERAITPSTNIRILAGVQHCSIAIHHAVRG